MISESDRAFMARAIAQAKRTDREEEWEKRPEQVPFVGAVVAQDGKFLAEGYHGEYAIGDHAEYTVLEKKLGSADLKGATLYTTLEPCVKRSSKKTACMRRALLRKIGRVVIGVVDPNRSINGAGIQGLRDVLGHENVEVFAQDSDESRQLNAILREFFLEVSGAHATEMKLYQLASKSLASDLTDPYIASPDLKEQHASEIKKWARTFREAGAPFWGTCLTVQLAPSLTLQRFGGWSTKDFIINPPSAPEFEVADPAGYGQYFERNKEARGFDVKDGEKFMLNGLSFSSTEEPICKIETRATRYSVVTHFKESFLEVKRSTDPRTADDKRIYHLKLAADFIEKKGSPAFPHSLCLHLLICTSDNMFLIAQRSRKLYYYPGAWSCSFEEQLAPSDFQGSSVTENWVKRAMSEELGLTDGKDYLMTDARILSVFLEADPGILNISVCGVVKIGLSSAELSEALTGKLRADYELTSWDYLDVFTDVQEELRRPSEGKEYHPSSAYRMYLGLHWFFGSAAIER